MSWADSIQSQLVIQTGDGKTYTPLWKNSCAKEIEYNIAQFDFPKVQGSKIDRGTPTARKFSLEIYFQGDDNLDVALDFEISARDPRPWSIIHPIYGSLLVQPISLKFDYSGFNVTQITGTILETLGQSALKISINPADKIAADKLTLDQLSSDNFQNQMDLLSQSGGTSSAKQLNSLRGINLALYQIGIKQIKLTEDAGNFLNKFNAANNAINQGINQGGSIMTAMQGVINFPSEMINTVKVRVDVIQNQFNNLRSNISNITSQFDKVNYESVGNAMVSSLAVNSINRTEYKTKQEVLLRIDEIQSMHDTFLSDLDSLQTSNGGLEDSYIPNVDLVTSLNDLINFTIANLDQIALSAKQERIVILENDSNAIILAHRFYGLLVDDSTITQFMDNNNISYNEILQIQKGRSLIFYI